MKLTEVIENTTPIPLYETILENKNLQHRLFANFRHQLFMTFFAIVVLISFVPIFTYLYFANTLGSKESIMSSNDTGLVLYDRSAKPFFTFYQGKVKDEITLDQIPKYTQQAVIASEDRDFYYHPGFSIKAMVRSALANFRAGNIEQGASTITQQLVKNSLLTPKRDYLRKYQEVVLAQEIDRRYSKDEILEMYLKTAYFGNGAIGIDEAANTYFSKKATELTVAESALLAALLPSPSALNPLNGGFEKAKIGQEMILGKMNQQGYISAEEKDQALAEEIHLKPAEGELNTMAPHFALMVRDQLVDRYGEERIARSGFKVYTSLDLEWQKYAEKVVADQVKVLASQNVTNGAAVVIDPKTGEVRALVGSKDWYDEEFGKFNIATSLRPPGSSFKPFVYLAAFDQRIITPSTILRDQPTRFANFDEKTFFDNFPTRAAALENLRNDPNAYYSPQNYDRKFRGPVLPRRALANSLNVPSVEVMQKVGVEKTLEMARRLGINTLKDPSNYGLSLVLGTGEVQLLEMTSAYAVFANQGVRNDPLLVLKIEDKNGVSVFQQNQNPSYVVSPQSAYLVTSILSDNKTRQEVFGNALTIPYPAAVKTGTTEDYKDAWTLGYSPNLAVGVWVGNNNNKPMSGIAGSLGAAPIWKSLMTKFLADLPREDFLPPLGLAKLAICPNNGLKLKESSTSAYTEYYLPGTEPQGFCAVQKPKEEKIEIKIEGRQEVIPSDPKTSPAPAPSTPPAPADKKEDKKDNKENNSGGTISSDTPDTYTAVYYE